MAKKGARVNALRQRCVQVRTFAGYIGLEGGRPGVDMGPFGSRIVRVFLNQRMANRAFNNTQMVTVTGPWVPSVRKQRARKS